MVLMPQAGGREATPKKAMYEHLFNTSVVTTLVALALAWLASALAGRPGMTLRVIAYTYTPAFAAAFFVVAPLVSGPFSVIDASGGFLLEFATLLLFCRLFVSLLKQVRRLDPAMTQRVLLISLAFQAAIGMQLVTSEGFGIFSEGSRIEYLLGGASAKYFTYSALLVTTLQAGLLARRLDLAGAPRALDYAVLLTGFAVSVLSGSKGGFFLWLISALALVNYRAASIRPRVVVLGLSALLLALGVTAKVVGDFLGLTMFEFIELALNRFLLNNDARALAFDLRGQSQAGASLLSESFRSLANLSGNAPLNPPLGLLLYELYFGTVGNIGANTSLVALILFFTEPGYAMLPSLVAMFGALLLYLAIVLVCHAVRGPMVRFALTIWGALALQMYSQDFLAFQLVLPLMVLGAGVLSFIDRGPAIAYRARTRRRRAAVAQLRHSSA